jgi:outer membrane immunogenic protein
MLGYLRFRLGLAVCALAVATLSNGGASAEPSAGERVLEKIAALEARIATLEAKNQQYKRDAEQARAQAQTANDKRFRFSNAAIPNKPASLQVKAYPTGPIPSNWSGAFWGASAGGAASRSRVRSFERYASSFAGNAPPFNVSGQDMLGTSGSNFGSGGMIDVFAGWNAQISNVVVGAQLEATASDINFSSAGSKAYTDFNANGPTAQSAVGDFRPQVASRWMASVLSRAGVLVNDQTLLYGIGGWTLARFEARNVTDNLFFQPVEAFLANGWTVGAGIERKMDSNWSVRAEYRYTNFGTARTDDHFNFQFVGPILGSQTYQRQTQYDQSMQSGRIGIAYAFNPLR